jgi:cytochrome oxidase Cu insertion factor (SCO1/SenC/PrrC family)
MKHYPNPRIISVVKGSAAMFAILLLASVFASGQANSYPRPQIPSAVGQIAPDFTLKDQDGKDFKLSDQRSHWVLLFFYRGYW